MNFTVSAKSCLKAASIILLCVAIGFILLLLAFSLPTDRIERHVFESVESLRQETAYFEISDGAPGTRQDNYTDALYLNGALVGSGGSIIGNALSGFTYSSENPDSIEQLADYFAGDSTGLPNTNVRFWNGYEVILKPLLELFVYKGIRQINLLLEPALLVALFYLMVIKGLKEFIPAVLMAVLLLNPLSLMLNMAYAGIFYCTVIPCIIMLKANDFLKKESRYLFFFIIIGCAVIYFNMNYFQLISFGFPFLFYYLLNGFKNTRDVLKKMGILFAAWFVGYVAMMAAKWVLYAVFVDASVFSQIADLILFRTSHELYQESFTRMAAIKMNLREAFGYKGWSLIEAAFIVWCIIKGMKEKSHLDGGWKGVILILAVSLLVLGRCYVFANHVYIHFWVTYRIFAIPVLALNIFLTDFKEGRTGRACCSSIPLPHTP